MSDNYQRPSQPMRDEVDAALGRKLPWRDRLVAWLRSKIPGLEGGESGATNGGYWGGITMWDRFKALLGRKP